MQEHNRIARFLVSLSLAAVVAACGGGGGGGGGPADVGDTASPDAVASRVAVAEAVTVEGDAPDSSSDPDAPSVDSPEDPVQSIESTDAVEIDVDVETEDAIAGIIARVSDANTFLNVPNPGLEEEGEGETALAKQVGDRVRLSGSITLLVSNLTVSEFCIEVAVVDVAGRVSNYTKLCFQLPGNLNNPQSPPPVANAGGNKTAVEGASVSLPGTATQAGNAVSDVSWTQISGPDVVLSDADTDTARFTAPDVTAATTLRFRLTATAPDDQQDTDDVVVTVLDAQTNLPPAVDAGANQTVAAATASVRLSGFVTDPDSGVTVNWSVDDAAINIIDANRANASFDAPDVSADTVYTFTLTANDGVNAPVSDTVRVTVEADDTSVGDAALAGDWHMLLRGYELNTEVPGASLPASQTFVRDELLGLTFTQNTGSTSGSGSVTSRAETFGALDLEREVADGQNADIDFGPLATAAAGDGFAFDIDALGVVTVQVEPLTTTISGGDLTIELPAQLDLVPLTENAYAGVGHEVERSYAARDVDSDGTLDAEDASNQLDDSVGFNSALMVRKATNFDPSVLTGDYVLFDEGIGFDQAGERRILVVQDDLTLASGSGEFTAFREFSVEYEPVQSPTIDVQTNQSASADGTRFDLISASPDGSLLMELTLQPEGETLTYEGFASADGSLIALVTSLNQAATPTEDGSVEVLRSILVRKPANTPDLSGRALRRLGKELVFFADDTEEAFLIKGSRLAIDGTGYTETLRDLTNFDFLERYDDVRPIEFNATFGHDVFQESGVVQPDARGLVMLSESATSCTQNLQFDETGQYAVGLRFCEESDQFETLDASLGLQFFAPDPGVGGVLDNRVPYVRVVPDRGRVDAGGSVTLTAFVEDADSGPDGLFVEFQTRAGNLGPFTDNGNGSGSVVWTAPATGSGTTLVDAIVTDGHRQVVRSTALNYGDTIAAASLIGTWTATIAEPQGDNDVALTFFDEQFYMIQQGNNGGDVNTGTATTEYGTYTLDPASGRFITSVIAQSDGSGGASDCATGVCTLSLGTDGTLGLQGEDGVTVTLDRLEAGSQPFESLIGSWRFRSWERALDDEGLVNVVFLDDSRYMLAQTRNFETGVEPSNEFGTYTYDPATGAFEATSVIRETDGAGGFVDSTDPTEPGPQRIEILGNYIVVEPPNNGEDLYFGRVR